MNYFYTHDMNFVMPSVSAESRLRDLRAEADAMILPLQDAVDLDVATKEEEKQLTVWKEYRVSLYRVTQQKGWPDDVDWPEVPVANY